MFARWLAVRSRSLALALAVGAPGLGALVAGCPQGGVGATCEIREDCQAGLACCTDCGRRGFCQPAEACGELRCPDAEVVTVDAALDAALEVDAFVEPDAAETPDASDVDGGT